MNFPRDLISGVDGSIPEPPRRCARDRWDAAHAAAPEACAVAVNAPGLQVGNRSVEVIYSHGFSPLHNNHQAMIFVPPCSQLQARAVPCPIGSSPGPGAVNEMDPFLSLRPRLPSATSGRPPLRQGSGCHIVFHINIGE